ncbi:VWA domain-containing protein, partial [Klebsiella pneumoniae]
MAYEAQISRTNPAAFLFVVDQSGSMSDKMSSGRSKAEFVADALNRTLMNLITRC